MASVIRFQTLGGLGLTDPAGREARAVLAQPKRLALLAYLALANSQGFRRRDTIIAHFWPELDDAHARGALRQAIRFLRRELGDAAIVTRGEEEIGVNRTALWCDATAFTQACEAGQSAEALELYHGHLLDGLFVSDAAPELDRWLDEERAVLRRRAVEAAWREAERQRNAGDRAAALTALHRGAALAPDDETAQARLIAFLDETGDRLGALEVYDRLSERLRREYDVEPAPETRQLIQRIRARESPLDAGVAGRQPVHPRVAAPSGRRMRGVLIGATFATLALAIAVAGLGRGGNVVPAALTIAVIPPGPGQPDTALARMGRDLSITISATLDGVGGIRAVDPSAILASLRSAPELAPTRAAATTLSRRLGAGAMVHGQLLRIGPAVRVELDLVTTDSLRQLAHATVTVRDGDLNAATDSVSWILLRQLWRRGTAPTPSLAAATTRSLPAMRAFLEGEQAVVQNRWRAAADAYREAIHADSTFILAEFRYVLAKYWQEEEADSASLAHLAARRSALPERDRLLLDAWLALADSASLTLQLYGETARRFPDHWPAWLLYGDFLYHFGPMSGVDMDEAVAALGRAAELNPGLVPAWHHLILAGAARNPPVAARARERLREIGWFSEPTAGVERFERTMLELLAASPPSSRLADRMARIIAELPDDDQAASDAPLQLLIAGFPAGQIDLNRRVLRLRISAIAAARQHRGMAWGWAARGAWDSAASEMAAAIAVDPTSRSAEDRYALAVTGAWIGATPDAEVTRAGVAAREAVDRAPPRGYATRRLVWFDGVAAFLRHDADALTAAIARAAALTGAQDTLVRRSLIAFRRALAGDRRVAATELVTLEAYCVNRKECGTDAPNIAIQRSAAIDWLLATGDTATALRLIGWHEAAQVGFTWGPSLAIGSLAYLVRARIEEARREPRLAERDYVRVLQRYDRPIVAQQHIVDEARVALGRLQAAASER